MHSIAGIGYAVFKRQADMSGSKAKNKSNGTDTNSSDVLIVGAGPAGLSLACMLDAMGMRTTVVERAPRATLAAPAYDGRDIALTHKSIRLLRDTGILEHIPGAPGAPIRHARVLNGTSPYNLHFEDEGQGPDGALGYLVSNHLIRKAAYTAFTACTKATLIDNVAVTGVETDLACGRVTLADGRVLTAKLVVAADSRFSETRRKMGISARMLDFGRTCIVCRMTLENPHDETAYECFQYDQTLAVLPLAPREVSVVLTLDSARAKDIMSQTPDAFGAWVTGLFEGRFGAMKLSGERYPYPLVAVYAGSFHARRFALVGDAAVGMHPVTAHGFNFGLSGADELARAISVAATHGIDIGSEAVLAPYSRIHRKATRPLYLATNAIVRLYTDTRRPARIARDVLLRLGNVLAPARRMITSRLTQLAVRGPA